MSYNDVLQKISSTPAQLVAVSKLQSTEKILNLYAKGQRIFAENYVQEALKKMEELKGYEIEWHFIGNLQKNKVKSIVNKFALIQSIDDLKVATKLNDYCHQLNIVQNILIQVNIADEISKSGVKKEELTSFVEEIKKLKNLNCQGLMAMPPLFDDPEKVRPYFRELKNLAKDFQLKELSMGTSHDYLIAIQEGATLIRLGTTLFGPRMI
jgi:pyridoxal phosphate enzyme (YggS family)